MKIAFLGDRNIPVEQLERFGGKAQKLHELSLAGFPVPRGFVIEESQELLGQALATIGGYPVAVRSSGALEDLGQASFAGLYETILDVKSSEELAVAIQKCFESKNSLRVKDYLSTKNISWTEETLKMSVLVQRMVPAKLAGVLFTINPLNGREEEMYLEFCEGVGERLVSGHVTPTQVVYDWLTGKKVKQTINDENTHISDAQLFELIELSIRIQSHYGAPQDIEWAIGPDDKVYILQSRPVTTFISREDTPELTNADFKDGGVSARVCTPFMFSVYREALELSMGHYFKQINLIPNDEHIQWIHYHYGRVYWNAGAVKEGLKNIPDFKEEDFDRDLGLQKDYGPEGPYKTPLTIGTIVSAVPVLIGLNREFLDCENMVNQFRDSFENEDRSLKAEVNLLTDMSPNEFQDWFLKVILFQNKTERNYFRTIYNNSNFQSEYKSYLKKLNGYEFGDEIDLMGELHGVSHLDVQQGLRTLGQEAKRFGMASGFYQNAREAFLKIHYHHGPAELDLMVPRWGENKEWVDELVKNYVEVSTQQQSRYTPTFEKINQAQGILGKRKFRKMTARSRDFLRIREEMRSFSTRAYFLLRLGVLEFARRNNLSELDVFMLDVLEIKNKVLDEKLNLPNTDLRKSYYEGYRNFKAPNDFGGTITASASTGDSGLTGLGCSPGEFVGKARVILDIHATHELTKDDILITLFTDPGWTPVLARVGGVITEVGGILSHAAVIGREYGIPAILNLINATQKIQDGDLIKMNGKTGVVEILEKASES